MSNKENVYPIVHTVAEAAAILRVKESWLRRKAASRAIPFTMLSGAYHFTPEHLAEIVRLNEKRPVDKPQRASRGRRPSRPAEAPAPVTQLRPRPRKTGPHRNAA